MDTIRAKEDVLEKITYGFHVVTTRADRQELSTRDRDYIAAGTISWAMQSSFEPPMVTIAVAKDSDRNSNGSPHTRPRYRLPGMRTC